MERKARIEAALFISSEPVRLSELAKIANANEEDAERILEELKEELEEGHRGLELYNSEDVYHLKVKNKHLEHVSHLTPYADMGKGLLKVLALVVYRQPITQSDIVKTIGNKAYGYVQELQDRGLLKAEKFGRTKALSVTDQFMSYFGISSRNDLLKLFEKGESEDAEKPVEMVGLEVLERINTTNN